MPPVGFETTNSVLERAKTVRALDHAATAIGINIFMSARLRAGSRFRRFLCFVLIDVRCFRVPSKMSSRIPGGARIAGWRPLA
jgi:hypothetical protein